MLGSIVLFGAPTRGVGAIAWVPAIVTGINDDGTLSLVAFSAQHRLRRGGAYTNVKRGNTARCWRPLDSETSIVSAIESLDLANPDLWTADGKPTVAAVEDVAGRAITAAERDAAWQQITADRDTKMEDWENG